MSEMKAYEVAIYVDIDEAIDEDDALRQTVDVLKNEHPDFWSVGFKQVS